MNRFMLKSLGLWALKISICAVILLVLSLPARAAPYAILFGGAMNPTSSYASMSLGLADTYNALIGYGWERENIYVLDGDGSTNIIGPYSTGNLPSPYGVGLVLSGGGDTQVVVAKWGETGPYQYDLKQIRSADDYTGDGLSDVDAPNNRAGLSWAVGELSEKLTTNDLLLIVSDTHGSLGGGYNMGLWDDTSLTGVELRAMLSLPYRQRAVLAMTCFSGALGPYMTQTGDRTIFLSSTNSVTNSYTCAPIMFIGGPQDGEWQGNRRDWLAAAADGIAQGGAMTWREMYDYAYAHDEFTQGEFLEFPTLMDPDDMADESFSLAGDANWDGLVDVSDLSILAGNFRQSGRLWRDGDFNGDGMVDVSDLSILAGNFRTPLGSPIPEPTTMAILAVGSLILLKVRYKFRLIGRNTCT